MESVEEREPSSFVEALVVGGVGSAEELEPFVVAEQIAVVLQAQA